MDLLIVGGYFGVGVNAEFFFNPVFAELPYFHFCVCRWQFHGARDSMLMFYLLRLERSLLLARESQTMLLTLTNQELHILRFWKRTTHNAYGV